MVNRLLEVFMKKNCKKSLNKNLEQEKYLKEKEIKCTSNGQDMIIPLIVGLMKKILNEILSLQMIQYFFKPFRSFGGNINVKVDLSNYSTKTDLKNVTDVDTLSFALKANLASRKTEVYKLDVDKLVPVPIDLSKLSDVVKNDVVKKTVYNKLVAKVDNIDTSDFVLKTKYNTDKTELEKKIPDVSNLVKKTKLTELESKIPDISNLATTNVLAAVENKIPSVSNLVRKQITTQKLLKLKKSLLIIITTNILLLHILILWLLVFLIQG